MGILYAADFPDRPHTVQEQFYAGLADRMPGNSSVSFSYMKEIPNVITVTEIPLSPRMARFKKAGILGCFDNTGVNSENYKEFI